MGDNPLSPEDVIVQLKRNGTFDELRKHLLEDFYAKPSGQEFLEKMNACMEGMVNDNPLLLEKSSAAFHDCVMAELERTGAFESVRKQVLGALCQEKYYQDRVDQEIHSIMGPIPPSEETSSSTSPS